MDFSRNETDRGRRRANRYYSSTEKRKPVISDLESPSPDEMTKPDLSYREYPLDGMAKRIEELEQKLQEEKNLREDKQIQLLLERVKSLEELVSTPPSSIKPQSGGSLQSNSKKRRRGATRSTEEEEDDKEDQIKTRIDETTGMEVEVVEEEEQSTTTQQRHTKTSRRLPPVIVGGHNDWDKITAMMRDENIKFTRAKTTREGIKVFFEHLDDLTKFRQKIRESGKEHFSYQLPHERKHHTVIRGLTKATRIERIQEDLKRKGIEAEVLPMRSKKNDQILPLFLVKTGSGAIYRVKRLLQLDVSIETKNKPRRPVQCFRCQRWGHTQMHCEFIERCVKCAAEHPSRNCDLPPKDDQSNATCCNCGGRHPASFRGCSRCPEARNPKRDRPASSKASKRTLRKP